MTFEEMRVAAQEYNARGDMVGMYRFLRDRVEQASTAVEEGIARTLLAEALARLQLSSPATIAAELESARRLFRGHPERLANLILVQLWWRATENDRDDVECLLGEYRRICAQYPNRTEVQRWQGRISQSQGRLAVAEGNVPEAIRHYERSVDELRRFEPDPGLRDQMQRMAKLHLARFALQAGNVAKARAYLDECEGSTISRLWETIRACTEVEHSLQIGNVQRVQFWMGIAQSWATPQSEATAILALSQARVAYAMGNLEKARLLTLEARRLAAAFKQDNLLPEIRAFYRLQASGVGAGELRQGGSPHAEASRVVAVVGHVSAAGRISRRQRL